MGFQQAVKIWIGLVFPKEVVENEQERNHRFLEEALELVQACGCTAEAAHKLVDHVFGRPVGETPQEVGGVMITLAALCNVHKIDMDEAALDELDRVGLKINNIREKQKLKPRLYDGKVEFIRG
jgi:NTP pyrophosphatase (non-canonical NTP hydrolase)